MTLSRYSPYSLSPVFKYNMGMQVQVQSSSLANPIHNVLRRYWAPNVDITSHHLSSLILPLSFFFPVLHSPYYLTPLTPIFSQPPASLFITFSLLQSVSLLLSDAKPSQALTLKEIDRKESRASQSSLSWFQFGEQSRHKYLVPGSAWFTTVMYLCTWLRGKYLSIFSENNTQVP